MCTSCSTSQLSRESLLGGDVQMAVVAQSLQIGEVVPTAPAIPPAETRDDVVDLQAGSLPPFGRAPLTRPLVAALRRRTGERPLVVATIQVRAFFGAPAALSAPEGTSARVTDSWCRGVRNDVTHVGRIVRSHTPAGCRLKIPSAVLGPQPIPYSGTSRRLAIVSPHVRRCGGTSTGRHRSSSRV